MDALRWQCLSLVWGSVAADVLSNWTPAVLTAILPAYSSFIPQPETFLHSLHAVVKQASRLQSTAFMYVTQGQPFATPHHGRILDCTLTLPSLKPEPAHAIYRDLCLCSYG